MVLRSVAWQKIQILLPFFLLALVWFFSFDYSLSTFIFNNILPYDQRRILQIFLLSATSVIFLVVPDYRKIIIQILDSLTVPIKISVAAFLYLGLVSAVLAKIPMAGFLEWSLFFLLIFFAISWCALALKAGETSYYLLTLCVFIAIAAYVYPVVSGYRYAIEHHAALYLFPYFINIRFFSQFAVFTVGLLPLADYWAKTKSLTSLRIVIFLLSGFWWALIILNGSRGLFFGVIIASLLCLLIFKKTILAWAWRQTCFIILGIVGVMGITRLIANPAFTDKQNVVTNNIKHIDTISHSTLQPRIELLKYSLYLIKNHPWFGVGPMHFSYAPPALLQQTDNVVAHPHNFLLLIFAEWGIPAGIAFVFVMLMMIFNFIKINYYVSKKSENNNNKIIFICFTISLIAGLFNAFVSGETVMPLSQTIFAVIAGSCMGLYFKENAILKNSALIKGKLIYLSVLIIAIGFSIFIMISCVIVTAPTLTQNEISWLQSQKQGLNTPFNPRFWMQGWLT